MNRILTTHVGSLVRPPRVMSYVEAIENGVAVDRNAFDACLREEIAAVIRRQEERVGPRPPSLPHSRAISIGFDPAGFRG